jgi:hypothetical protein
VLTVLLIAIEAKGLQCDHPEHRLACCLELPGVDKAAHKLGFEEWRLLVDEQHQPDPHGGSSLQIAEKPGQFDHTCCSGPIVIRTWRVEIAVIVGAHHQRLGTCCRGRGLNNNFNIANLLSACLESLPMDLITHPCQSRLDVERGLFEFLWIAYIVGTACNCSYMILQPLGEFHLIRRE